MAEIEDLKSSQCRFESDLHYHFVEKVIHFFQQTYAHFVQWKGRDTTDVEI